jgi:glycine dehydrogenase subunit 1
MNKYIPHTAQDLEAMLAACGVTSVDELFSDIPEAVRFRQDYNLPDSFSELEVVDHIERLANQNQPQMIPFVGAGAYDHYVPSIIKPIITRSEFATSYTPYQPEVSQGTLTYIFEFQTMMSRLFDLPVANASMYDAFTAAVEAAMMMNAVTKRNHVLVASSVNPSYKRVIETYARFRGFHVTYLPEQNGRVDQTQAAALFTNQISGVIVQSPNYYGLIEDVTSLSAQVHEIGGLVTLAVNPLAFAILKTPGEMGVDIVVGDAQPFGIGLNYGGPYIGFMVSSDALVRKLPGRIVGETVDVDGKRAFVLTLRAREQDIRREKATSNICSNQSLNVLAASVFLSVMGPQGLKEMATQNYQKAHYAYDQITSLPGFKKVYDTHFFNEFVVETSIPYEQIAAACEEDYMIPGLYLGENKILFCVTEKRSKEQIDHLVDLLGGLDHA